VRRLLVILVFLILSVWAGIAFVRHPGAVVLIMTPWTVEMPLWFAVMSLLLVFFVFYLIIFLINQTYFSWMRWKYWWQNRRHSRSYSKTQRGLLALIEAQWSYAEKLLLEGMLQSIEPLTNYLGVAKAAHEQKAFERRDAYLQKALQLMPQAEVAIGIIQAEFQLQQNHIEPALATLRRLQRLAPKNMRILRLLRQIYQQLADWPALLLLIPQLGKARVLSKEQSMELEKEVYIQLFVSANKMPLAELRQHWQRAPRWIRYSGAVVVAYLSQLQHFPEAVTEVDDLIRRELKKEWNPDLMKIYGAISLSNPNKQLANAEAWLKQYGQHPELLFLLGKLNVRCQLWGKARDYYAQGLAQQSNAQACLEYGRLLEDLGDEMAAARVYRQNIVG